jgi:hypothetical protein
MMNVWMWYKPEFPIESCGSVHWSADSKCNVLMKYWIISKHERNIPSAWCVPRFLFCQILTHMRLNVQRHGTTFVLDTSQITASRFLMQWFVMTHTGLLISN